jgi:hypothetical protein
MTVIISLLGVVFGGLIGGAAVMVLNRGGFRALYPFLGLTAFALFSTFASAAATEKASPRVGVAFAAVGAFALVGALVQLFSVAWRYHRAPAIGPTAG